MIFKVKFYLHAKCKSVMDSNIHKAYSLVIGQCTDLLQRKVTQQAEWDQISSDQNSIAILEIIKTVILCFKYQKILPFDLYQAKSNIYAFHQDYMTNQDYLQWFNNLVGEETEYNGFLYDQKNFYIVTK